MAKGKEIWVCPQCNARIDIAPLGLYAEVRCPRCLYTDRVHAQLGNFRLDGVLGVGGMSVVYRAFDVVLHRALALKVLNDTFRDQPERIERFENESAMMARVRHENVTSVYSAGRAYGQFYIAMELVEGSNLEHMVTKEKPLAPAHALGIIHQVAKGLEAAHKAGLLHRDMKPGNVLITPDEQVKVIDFGLALDSKEGETEEIIWATPYYVPPETLRREPEDVRTDIYALGMTLRYLLTGIESFGGPADSVTALLERKRRLKSFVKQYPHMLHALGELVDHMTAFAPADRPASYQELIEEIAEVQQALAKRGAEQKKGVSKAAKVAYAMAASVALGGLLAYTVFPSKQNVQQELLPVAEWSVGSSAEQQELSHALALLDQAQPDESAEALLALAEQAQESCIGAWSALLAKTIAKHAILKNEQAGARAQGLLEQHLRQPERVNHAGSKVFSMLTGMEKMAEPTAEEWKWHTGGWAEFTPQELEKQKAGMQTPAQPAPLGMIRWYDLAEKSLWLEDEGSVNECMERLRELGSQLHDEYSGLNHLYAAAERRLAARRLAMMEQKRLKALGLASQLKLGEAAAMLESIAKSPKTSPRLRDISTVQYEACVIGKEMVDMVRRKFPDRFGEESDAEGFVSRVGVFDSNTRTWVTSVTADSEQRPNPAVYAVDGDMSTRWCAQDEKPGHQLVIKTETKEKVDALVIYWENNLSNTIELVITTAQGEKIKRNFMKREESTRMEIGGKNVTEIRITVNGTGWWKRWASVREVELYGADGKKIGDNDAHQDGGKFSPTFKEELRIVADIFSDNVPQANNRIRTYLSAATKDNQNFAVLAHDWLTRWDNTLDVWHMKGEQAKQRPSDEELKKALERIQGFVRAEVLPDKGVGFLNQRDMLPSGRKAFLMDEEARFLQQLGVVKILATSRGDLSGEDRYRIVPLIGLKNDDRGDQNVRKGVIAPYSHEDAEYFVQRGSAAIVNSFKELMQYRYLLHAGSVSGLLVREPVL